MISAVNYRTPAAGGAGLATDVYLPPAAHESGVSFPALIIRTPYGRKNLAVLGDLFARSGYAVVIQDVRGTGESDGSFGFLAQEPADAESTARWTLSQPWCGGRLGIVGISYLASASIALPSLFPDEVKAAVWVTIPVSWDTLTWQGGALRLHHALPWVLIHEGKMEDFPLPETYRTLPLVNAIPRGMSSIWEDLVAGGPGSEFWVRNDLRNYLENCRVPGLHFGGWFDFLLDATLKPYETLPKSGVPQRLFLGPWSHNGIVGATRLAGGVDYGPDSGSSFVRKVLEWFDRWLKGNTGTTGTSGSDADEEVRLFFTGSEPGWRECRAWPLEDAVPVRFYLAGHSLVMEREARSDAVPGEGVRRFKYDPLDPVPTEGGALWELPRAGLTPGPMEQHSHLRQDVLVFETPALDKPLRIAGPVSVLLYASSSCPDTDFTGKLVDVDPEGTGRIVADGIVRARFRNGPEREEFLEPGKVHEFWISLGACAHVFGEGHKIRLEVSSSNFPKYDRNMNTLRPPWLEDRPAVAVQEVHFGRRAPSRLEVYCV